MVKLSHIAVCCVCLLLGGCALAGLGGTGAPETFDLTPAAIAKQDGRKVPLHVSVAMPSATRPLETDQILVRDSAGKLSYFGGAAWGDRLPRLVQSRLVQALADSGRFRVVGTSQDRVQGDVTLALELRSFNVQVDNGHAKGVVDLVAKLIDERQDRVVATRRFEMTAPALKDDAASGVAALTQAFHTIAQDIVAWTANPRAV